MNGLPLGWSECELKELTEYITSGSRDWSKYYASSGALFVRTQDINTNCLAPESEIARVSLPESVEGKRSLILEGDILITITGANVGKCAHVDRPLPEAYVSQSVALVRLLDKSIARFIQRQLMTPGEDGQRTLLQQRAYGLGRPVLNLDNIRSLRVCLAPEGEQKRILGKLDKIIAKVNGCRERLERVPVILKCLRQSVLVAAISGELTKDWRAANPDRCEAAQLAEQLRNAHESAGGHKSGNAAPPTDGVHDLSREMFPKGWRLTTIRDLVSPSRPVTYGILKPGPELEKGVPYIRVADFPNEKLNLSTIRNTSATIDQEFKRSRLSSGDLLLSIRGTVGRVINIPPELEGANITQDSARLSIQPLANRDYVLWYLRSEFAQTRMQRAVKGVAVRGINIGDVRALQVPLPPSEEQSEIVRRVERLFAHADVLEKQYSLARAQIDRMVPTLLAKAFRGELVPQDPNDEPASALLERIRFAQALAPSKQRRRKGPATVKQSLRTEADMLKRSEIQKNHLSNIIKECGPLTPDALWNLSKLEIDDFYDQLKYEEANGFLREIRRDLQGADRLLEAVA